MSGGRANRVEIAPDQNLFQRERSWYLQIGAELMRIGTDADIGSSCWFDFGERQWQPRMGKGRNIFNLSAIRRISQQEITQRLRWQPVLPICQAEARLGGRCLDLPFHRLFAHFDQRRFHLFLLALRELLQDCCLFFLRKLEQLCSSIDTLFVEHRQQCLGLSGFALFSKRIRRLDDFGRFFIGQSRPEPDSLRLFIARLSAVLATFSASVLRVLGKSGSC